MKPIPCKILAFALCAHLSGSAFASLWGQDQTGGQEVPPLDVANFTVEQTFQSNFRSGHGYNPDYQFNNATNTWHYEVDAARRTPLADDWYFKTGVDVARYDFGDNRSLAPNLLQFYALQLGLEHFENGEPGFVVQTNPGLYFSHQLDIRNFDAPTKIELFYPMADSACSLVGGARLSMQSNYPVLPIAGVLWHIDPQWDLQACLPAPRLVYSYSPALKLWGGGEITGGSFRYDDQGKVDYYEIRTGCGMNYDLPHHLSLDFDGGAAVVRNFALRHVTEETHPAPYVKLALDMAF